MHMAAIPSSTIPAGRVVPAGQDSIYTLRTRRFRTVSAALSRKMIAANLIANR